MLLPTEPTIADLLANFDFQNGPDSVELWGGEALIDAFGNGAFDPDEIFAGRGSYIASFGDPVPMSCGGDDSLSGRTAAALSQWVQISSTPLSLASFSRVSAWVFLSMWYIA